MTAATLALSTMLVSSLPGQGDPQAISLEGAEIVATHHGQPREQPIEVAIDGDESTWWIGEAHDLTALPTNVILTLPEAVSVGAVELLTDDAKGYVRLKDVEVYRPAPGGWAPMGAIRDNDEVLFTIDLSDALVSRLRIRIRDTQRPDHAFPRIYEIRLTPAPPQGADDPSPVPIPDESLGERLFIANALGGSGPVLPDAEYDPAVGHLGYVRAFMDTLLERGTDRWGEVHSPMWVSILTGTDLEHPGCVLPPIEGQRPADRAAFGGNLQHDLMLLLACEPLSELTGDDRYRDAARDYLRFFLDTCTHTATGLWPWGEHAHWDFFQDAVGHNTHEYLGAPPLRFWEWAWELNSEAVLREADGLINHIYVTDSFAYSRHADVSRPLPEPRAMDGYLDFPRHGGFYIQVWAFAYNRTGDAKYLDWIERMMDHHVATRDPQSHLLPATTTTSAQVATPASQLSLAISMLESVPLLGETDTARRCHDLGLEHLQAVAALPHQPEQGRYISSCAVTGPGAEDSMGWTPAFSANYGGGFACADALLWTQAYRLTEEERYLDLARPMAQWYADTQELPEAALIRPDAPQATRHVRAQVFAGIINLMETMHELDGGEQWLPAAERWAQVAISKLYCDAGGRGIFRGATNLWYYESELWVSNLAYALVRLHTLTQDTDVTVPPNYFLR